MKRGRAERLRDVRRLLQAANAVYEQRARYADDIVRATGLSPEGVELGFASLEREAADGELSWLLAAAGDAERVHVILSANVFVAPLRALVLARAAAAVVTLRPSPRDPVVWHALVQEAGDPGLAIVGERAVRGIEAGEIHVYARNETIAAVRAEARPGVKVRGHGAGMGIAVVTAAAAVNETAEALAVDVVAFDQRGCLSPRVALVEGDEARAESFARAIDASFDRWEARVPRGALTEAEKGEAAYWREMAAFVGPVLARPAHAVAVAPALAVLSVPPPGRHLLVVPSGSIEDGIRALAPHVVTVGTDDPARVRALAPAHARVAALGCMQRPPLDGPVDRRGE